ncbi:hypothetical protein [Phycicoccus sp.]|uniref:hypothetical protein n=1 Tax=Phycicoccus sp. TaxID=1902410 RepID=UPI002CBDD3A1|nr:hypothetical protein [Phycicoccus sp.]HMM93925.1 hypothetical protein [Phycicoccus sp.]
MTWLVPLLSFVGGLVGAGAAGWVALRGQRQDARIRLGQQLAEGLRGQEEVDLSLAPGDDGDVEQEEAP